MLNNKSEQTGRSMVEMLGVLAVIGVLSITGISGYTTAMNKHKANEILDAASKRAVAVSTQIQRGKTDPTLDEFEDNKVGGAEFSTNYTPVGTNRFKIAFASDPDPDVLAQIKSIVGTDGIVRDIDGGLVYNNDLTTDAIASDYKTQSDCKSPFKWCSKLGTSGQCVEGNDCCSGITTSTCLICDTATGEITKPGDSISCEITPGSGTNDGKCDGQGSCTKPKLFYLSESTTHTDASSACLSITADSGGWKLASLSDYFEAMGGKDKCTYNSSSNYYNDCPINLNFATGSPEMSGFVWLKECWEFTDKDGTSCNTSTSGYAWMVNDFGLVDNGAYSRNDSRPALCVK